MKATRVESKGQDKLQESNYSTNHKEAFPEVSGITYRRCFGEAATLDVHSACFMEKAGHLEPENIRVNELSRAEGPEASSRNPRIESLAAE